MASRDHECDVCNIGQVVLVASGFHQEVNKSIIYSCLAFSLGVEMLNIKLRGKQKNIRLNDAGDKEA